MIIYWVIADGAPVRSEPMKGAVLTRLAKYAQVEKLDEAQVVVRGLLTQFAQVRYVESSKAETVGWVYAGYLEPYVNPFRRGVVRVRNATVNPNDAEQYLVWRGNVQYNLCGFFCAAYCAGWEGDIEDMLDLLVREKPSLMARVFPKWAGSGTSDYDLDVMLNALGFETPAVKIGAALYDRILERVVLTSGRMQEVLNSHRVIYSVRLDKRSGRLNRSGILHWVVIEDVVPNEFGGVVDVYNPFGNKREAYEWEQVVESGGVPYGVAVPRR
jgi:hypothetical protein